VFRYGPSISLCIPSYRNNELDMFQVERIEEHTSGSCNQDETRWNNSFLQSGRNPRTAFWSRMQSQTPQNFSLRASATVLLSASTPSRYLATTVVKSRTIRDRPVILSSSCRENRVCRIVKILLNRLDNQAEDCEPSYRIQKIRRSFQWRLEVGNEDVVELTV
jgi:hypothetical protein